MTFLPSWGGKWRRLSNYSATAVREAFRSISILAINFPKGVFTLTFYLKLNDFAPNRRSSIAISSARYTSLIAAPRYHRVEVRVRYGSPFNPEGFLEVVKQT